MSTEWIRPDGCEGGACVEYRTVGGKVFVRKSTEENHMIVFAVAEWDTFVAGLVGDKICYEHADYPEIVAAYEQVGAENAHLEQLVASTDEQVAAIAAENARLRQERADDLARAAANTAAHLTEALDQRDAAVAEAAVLRHRDRRTRAVVEAARSLTTHGPAGILALADPAAAENWSFERDRRWVNLRRALDALEGPPSPPESTEPVQQPQPVVQPTDGPEPQGEAQGAAGASWLAQQFHETYERLAPSFGYETREASAKPWADVPDQNKQLMIAVCAELLPAIENWLMPAYGVDISADGWVSVTERIRADARAQEAAGPSRVWDKGEGPVAWLHVPQRKPRVWNAGDPEPEGVTRVTDDDGDLWTRDGKYWYWTNDEGARMPAAWDPLTVLGPLTEVLPEPTTATGGIIPTGTRFDVEPDPVEQWVPLATTQFRCRDEYVGLGLDPSARIVRCNLPLGHDGDHDEMIDGEPGNSWPRRKPDGEVPEAGRAGEAQTILAPVLFPKGWTVDEANAGEYYRREAVEAVLGRRSYFADSSPDAHKNSSDVRPQGRTEVGLDAAIEAAVAAARFEAGDRIWPAGVKLRASDVNAAIEERIRIGLHAASPLIERAALNAAADRMEGRGYTSSSAVAWLRLLAEGKTV